MCTVSAFQYRDIKPGMSGRAVGHRAGEQFFLRRFESFQTLRVGRI